MTEKRAVEGGGRPAYKTYSRSERIADAALHVAGTGTAMIAAPLLVVLGVIWQVDGPTLAASAVYGATLIAMFVASAGYHMVTRETVRELLRRFDRAAIYAKIAGTYTPFAVMLGGERALALLVGMWAAAAFGIALEIVAPQRFEWMTLGLYIAMGWAVLFVGGPILSGIGNATLVLLIAGGVLYTVGVGFHLWDSLPYQNAIWHAFVLVASMVLYAAVIREVAVSAQ